MNKLPRSLVGGAVTLLSVAALAVTGLPAAALPTASATAEAVGTATTAATDPTVTADVLPTVQIDGVAWAQAVVGNTVYVGGLFTTARPAGSPAGVNTVPRANLLAYDLTTGALITSWAPTTNGRVLAIHASADGRRIFVGGAFNQVNGSSRNRFVALDAATGAVDRRFPEIPSGDVQAITSTPTTVYVGGTFNTAVGGLARNKLAAFDVATGAVRPWSASPNRPVYAMATSPDRTQIYIGGGFTSVNGVERLGTAALDATTAAVTSWSASPSIYNSGADARITSLATDGELVYGTGLTFLSTGQGVGNLEGSFASDPRTGAVRWLADCHGDSQSIFANPGQDHVYVASHAHSCNNIGAFPEFSTRRFFHGAAYTKAVRSVVTPDTQGGNYANNAGFGAPEQLNFYPTFTPSGFAGSRDDATWHVAGNANYVVWGGDFRAVNGAAQQGLVRMAKPGIAPGKVGPSSGSETNPTVVAKARGTLNVSWSTTSDRDDGQLTYTVLRNGAPVHTVTAASRFWSRPRLSFADTGLANSTSYRYVIRTTDKSGNTVSSAAVTGTTTAGTAAPLSPYAAAVLGDNPHAYWRMDEPSGALTDWTGFSNLTASTGVTRGVTGAVSGDPSTAARFNGTSTGRAYTTRTEIGLHNLSLEAWFKTTSTAGGKIIGYGSSTTATNSTVFDRHVYMTAAGRLVFGAHPGGIRTIQSPAAYNDGNWHHVVATLGKKGMELFVDGARVAAEPTVISGNVTNSATLAWHIGGDNLTGWPGAGSANFAGDIDEVATYGRQLDPAEVSEHFTAGSGQTANVTPTARFTPTGDVLSASVDASASTDPDGTIASYQWSWGDGTTSTTTTPRTTHAYATPGTYRITLVVTDDDGATATATASAAVRSPDGASDAFSRVVSDGWGTADSGGQWTTTSGAASVDGSVGVLTGAPGSLVGATLPAVTGTGFTVGATLSVPGRPTGDQVRALVRTRVSSAGEYRLKVGFKPDGYMSAWLVRVDSAGRETTISSSLTVPGGQYSADTPVRVLLQTQGTSPTTVRAKVWRGATEPTSWLLSVSDSTAALQSAGATGFSLQTQAAVTSGPGVLRVDDVVVGTQVAPANQAPTAAFTATSSGLSASVDGSASADPDGRVVSYAWAWGDGTTTTTTTPTATHPYGEAGTYPITLVVTDDRGATATATRSVTVAEAANAAPTATFTTSVSGQSVSVDAAGSTDPDGTITQYDWTWGDGTSSTTTTPTATHPYAAAGTYEVGLTVTDDRGATGTAVRTVTVAAGQTLLASDLFDRTVTSGWGTADVGGDWTTTAGAARVAGGQGILTGSAGTTSAARLAGLPLGDSSTTATVSVDRLPTGGGVRAQLRSRNGTGGEYRLKLHFKADGRTAAWLSRTNSSNVESTIATAVTVPDGAYTAGTRMLMRLDVVGSSPTVLRAKVWRAGTPEPAAWLLQASDPTSALQAPGAVGISMQVMGDVTNAPVELRVDDFAVRAP